MLVEKILSKIPFGSVAEWVKASFYDDSDRRIMSSTRTLVMLLRLWIRRFTIIISAWWLRTSSKFAWEEVKTSTEKLGKWSTPKRVRIRPKHSAPSLSRDRRIKMHQTINQCNMNRIEHHLLNMYVITKYLFRLRKHQYLKHSIYFCVKVG